MNEPVAIQVGNDLTVPTKDSNSTMHVLFNTFATGALGAAFWIVAAQLFPERAVASAVGASSLLVVVSFIAQLNLATSLSRFLPGGGAKQRHMVTYSYQISVLCSVVAGAIVVLVGLARGGSVIEGGDIWLTAAIALSIPVWTIFALQDGALVAVRKAHWLAIENGSTAAAKIILLGLFIAIPGQAPILVAWTLPAVPAVLLVNRALYRGLLGTGERMEKPSTLIRYAGFDMVGTSATLLSLRAVPLIVVETTAGNEAAYVGVPLSILTVAAVALMAVSRVVLAEMSHAPERSDEVAKRIHRFVMSLLIPGSIVAALLSYPALRFAGAEYATGGALVLAIGMLGLIPAADVESHFARLRYADRMTRVSVIQLIRVGVFLGFTAIGVVIERPELIGAAYAAANLVTVPIARWTT